MLTLLHHHSCDIDKKKQDQICVLTVLCTSTSATLKGMPRCASDCLRGVGALDLIQHDPRPTFVIDTTRTPEKRHPVPCFWNAAFAEVDSGSLLNALLNPVTAGASTPQESAEDFSAFRNWLSNLEDDTTHSHTVQNHTWIKITVSKQWTVVSRSVCNNTTAENRPEYSKPEGTLLKVPSRSKTSNFDWTYEAPPDRMTPHVAWARSIDWASTSLGPMTGWSSQLRSITTLVMQDPRPAVVFCGPDLIMVYNETYIDLLGGFHPCMGISARVALVQVWGHYFEPLIERNLTGETIEGTNNPIQMIRNGFMEETYFSWSFIPVFDSDGAVIAHYEPLIETTKQVVAERRAQTILRLSEEVPRARSLDTYWDLAIHVLSQNTKDMPFVMLYAAESLLENSSSSSLTGHGEEYQDCILRGSFGLPQNSPATTRRLDYHGNDGFMPYFRESLIARGPVTVDLTEGSPAAELVRGVEWKGYGDPCRAAMVCPITPTSSKDNILGYMVFGMNPRRPYDDDYRHFVLVASRLLSTSLTSIILHEEDINRRERTIKHSEIMKQELRNQLAVTQKEAERSAMKFQRFAESADIGIFIVGLDGIYSYRNEAWWRILYPDYHRHDIDLPDAWVTLIDDKHILTGQQKFTTLIETKEHQ